MVLALLAATLVSQTNRPSSAGEPATVEGNLAIVCTCSADGIGSRCDILLTANGTAYRLIFSEAMLRSLPSNQELAGRYWTVSGIFTNSERTSVRVNSFIESYSSSGTSATQNRASAISKPYLTILAKFSDYAATEPHPKSYYEGLFGATAPLLNHYFTQMSYGAIDLNGSQVYGWVTLPRPLSYYGSLGPPQGFDFIRTSDDAIALVDPFVDFSQYAGINVITNVTYGTSSSGGTLYKTLDGQSRTWGVTVMNGGSDGLIGGFGHEMGHSLGFDHSAGPYASSYDSKWDQMSGGFSWLNSDPTYGSLPTQTNVYHRDAVGWMPSSKIFEAFPGTNQTITLKRAVEPGTTGYAMARVWQGSGQNYYTVELRKNYPAYDVVGNASTGLPGEAVLIHDVDDFRVVTSEFDGQPYRDRCSRIVDPDGDGDPNDFGGTSPLDCQWKPGETFSDSSRGISIKVNSISATDASITITVSSALAQPYWVRNTNDSGPGSLRGAMSFFKHVPAMVTTTPVSFRIPTSDPGYQGGVWRIKPLTSLEINGSGMTIDASSQSTFAGNTNPSGPEVVIDGSDVASSAFAIILSGANNTFKGFNVQSMDGPAVWIHGQSGLGTGNRVVDCYIGTDHTGTLARPSGQNLVAITDGATGNRIENCVVSGSTSAGIALYGGTTNNVIIGNKIGTNALGTLALANTASGIGIYADSVGNTIQGNLCSGNGYQGIYVGGLGASGNILVGNVCGLNASQSAAIPNGEGVGLADNATGNRIGGPNLADRNVLSGNRNVGFFIGHASGNTVQGNYVGCDASGALRANSSGGAQVYDTSTNNAILSNTIVGGQYNGVYLADLTTTGNTFDGNTIGWLPGGGAAGFGYDAVVIHNGPSSNVFRNNTIGNGNRCILLTSDAGKPSATRNLFRSNSLSSAVYDSIDLGGDGNWGINSNDNLDADTGPNNLQNYPVLLSALRTSAGTQIQGTLNSTPNRSFTLEFFASDVIEGSGHGPGQRPLGTLTVSTNSSGNASFTANVGPAVGSWISATCTDATTNDTSEFAQSIGIPNGLALYTVSPTSVNGGVSAVGAVSFGVNVSSTETVVLSSNKPSVSVPASVLVVAGTMAKSFSIATSVVGSDQTATLSATNGGLTKTATLTVKATISLASLTLVQPAVEGGASVGGSVTMSGQAQGTATVSLSSSSSRVLVPSSVIVSAGSTSVGFTVNTLAVGTVGTYTLSATFGATTKLTTLKLTPCTVRLVGLTATPATVKGGIASLGRVTLSRAAPSGFTVYLRSTDGAAVVASTLAIPAGQTSATFTITTTPVASTRTARIIASRPWAGYGGSVLRASVTITP